MSEPIKAGDLVQIVRPNGCTCGDISLGWIFCVQAIVAFPGGSYCGTCKRPLTSSLYIAARSERGHYGLERLKRIPPLPELEGLESEEVDKLPSQRMIEAAKRYKRLVTSK